MLLPPENAGAYTHTELLVLHIRLDITHICALSVCFPIGTGGGVRWVGAVCCQLSVVRGKRRQLQRRRFSKDGQICSPGMVWEGHLQAVHTLVCVHQIFGKTSAMQYEDAVVATTLRSRRSGVRC